MQDRKQFQQSRADRVSTAMMGAADYEDIVDLLADIRHYCDVTGREFDDADGLAHRHYLEEIFDRKDNQ